MENIQMIVRKVSLVALPSLQSRVHYVHTTLQTPRKSMANAIHLLLPTHAQDIAGGIAQKINTQLLLKIKPHAQKLLTQFLRHLPTHHPEVETNRKMLTITKSEISAISVEGNYWGMAWHCLQRAAWRNGGSSPQRVQCKLATACSAGSSVEAATTPSRHHVGDNARTEQCGKNIINATVNNN